MEGYFDGDKYINWELVKGILRLGGKVIGVLGVVLLAATVIYIIRIIILAYLGKVQSYKEHVKIIAFGVIGSVLLLGGGWITVVKFTHKAVTEPTQDIVNEEYEENKYYLPGLEE